MNPERTAPSLPDTFAQHEGELIALQENAAHALGLSDTHFRDPLADGTQGPMLTVIPAGAFEDGAAPRDAAPAQERPRRAALIERGFAFGVLPVTTVVFVSYG